MLYIDKKKGIAPSDAIAAAKRVLKDPANHVAVQYDSLGKVKEASSLVGILSEHLGADQGWLCAYCMRRIDTKPKPGVSRKLHNEHYIPRHQDYQAAAKAKEEGKQYKLPYPEYSQSDLDKFSLDYDNLFAVCDGKYQKDAKDKKGEKRKTGSDDSAVGMASPMTQPDTNRKRTKGKTTCDQSRGNQRLTVDPRRADHIATISYKPSDATIASSDPDIDKDLNDTLNLNYRWLKEEREWALQELYDWFEQHGCDKDFRQECASRLRTLQEGRNGRLQPFAPMLIMKLEQRMRR
ncbi:hypothetical protein [Bifidobacterium saguinibicoloris]|uniref:hypothetical protein n=1 Tax=Bifidobacterium saguinibicoloris TaxID=2834433 RepID=UPI001C570D65|nr:hypothetical protein [Bifidobacterium saguinibicoloris]MBW3081723.1 hypothetical protein [Bifidobacterium saguinibicoloris]